MERYVADGIFLLIGLVLVILCAKRGFFATVLRLFRFIVALVLAYQYGGVAGNFFSEKFLYSPFREMVAGKVADLNAKGNFDVSSLLGWLPDFLVPEALQEKLNAIEAGGGEIHEAVTDTVAGWLSDFVGRIVGTVIVFIATLLVISIVCKVLKILKKKFRLMGTLDSVLGAVLGMISAWLVLSVLGSCAKLFLSGSPIYTDSVIVKFFGESSLLDILKFLNVNDWFTSLIK